MKGLKKAYFIGIGGIGMSALAQLMQDAGVVVSGSDREESPVTDLLTKKGIDVFIGQKTENVPEDADLIVYSEAVWDDNPERMRAKELGIREQSYFEALGDVSRTKKTIAVAGTHGKTTTTGMTAKILSEVGASPSAVVGSIVKDFGSNYLRGDSELLVVEACEYKRDFMSLSPFVLVITNIEWDHTDFYPTLADVQAAFRALMEKVPADGAIITAAQHPNIAPLLQGLTATVVDYLQEPTYGTRLPGTFNTENAQAAAAAAHFILEKDPLTVAPEQEAVVVRSLALFEGTWRRFDYKGKTRQGADVYDDYAHHPTAIKKTLEELRKRVPEGSMLYVAFHPHLYSRTRDLLDDFAASFKEADGVFIAPIYPAREVDDGSISSAMLAERIAKNGTTAEALSFEEIRQAFETYPKRGDIVMTMGAGDIYKVADMLVA